MSFSSTTVASTFASIAKGWLLGDGQNEATPTKPSADDDMKSLSISMENGIVVAGSELKGTVELSGKMAQDWEPSVQIEVVGNEFIQINGKIQVECVTLFKQFTLSVYSNNENHCRTYPFAFDVSANLPASTSLRTSSIRAGVVYSMKAIVHTSTASTPNNLSADYRFVVAANGVGQLSHTGGGGMPVVLQSLGSFSGIKATGWLQKSMLIEGETAQLKVRLNSTSVKEVVKLILYLCQTILLDIPESTPATTSTRTQLGIYSGFGPCFLGERYFEVTVPCVYGAYSTEAKLLKVQYSVAVEFHPAGRLPPFVLTLPISIVPAYIHQQVAAIDRSQFRLRPAWQADEDASTCAACQRVFFSVLLFPRKHHCRHCGKVFCVWCCKRWANVTNLEYHVPVRICDGCFPVAVQGGHAFSQPLSFDVAESPLLESESNGIGQDIHDIV